MQSFIITASSALSTLQILDRQARRDCGKVVRLGYGVYRVLSSRQAIQTYRLIWSILQLACMVAIACGATVREWCDAYVDQCLESPDDVATVEPEAAPEPAPVKFSDVVVPFRRRVRLGWESMNVAQLRKECQKAGIRWRNAHGNGKHLSKNAMVQALSAA